jgi:type I restriction enzyme S subunit
MTTAWPRVSLGQLLRLERRPIEVLPTASYQEIGIYCFGKGIFHKEPRTGLEVGDKDLFLLREGDFILQVTFAWEGAVALVSSAEDGMYGSTRYPTFRVDTNRCEPQFLLHYFKTDEGLQQLVKICPGSAGRNRVLSIKRIPEVFVPLPPIPEQRRLVARIKDLTEQINEARALRRDAAKEAEALLASYRRSLFGATPKDDWVALGTFVAHIENGKSPATDGRPAASNEWGVLKVGAVSFGSYDEKQNKALPISFNAPESLQVRSGDFLMSRANTRELVGACAIVRETRAKLMLSDKIFRFVFREPRSVLPEYMNQVLKSPALREQIERAASGTSSTMKNISKEKVLALRLPPFGLAKQQEAMRALEALQSEVDGLRHLHTETATELDALLPSVLSNAFAGELNVPTMRSE